MRFRFVFMGLGSLLTLALLILSDPSVGAIKQLPFGGATVALLLGLVLCLLYITLLHLSRKGLLDYIDLEVFFKKALETSVGAGLAIIGVGLVMLSCAVVVVAVSLLGKV